MVLLSVFDRKALIFSAPFASKNRIDGIRSFEQACRDPKVLFSMYPSDYELFVLAEFDQSTGVFKAVRESLALAADFSPSGGSNAKNAA